MIDEEMHEQWVMAGEPMGSFQTFIFAEWQKTLAEVKRLREILSIAEANLSRKDWDYYIEDLIEAGLEKEADGE